MILLSCQKTAGGDKSLPQELVRVRCPNPTAPYERETVLSTRNTMQAPIAKLCAPFPDLDPNLLTSRERFVKVVS